MVPVFKGLSGNGHIILLHAHDETDELVPGYCQLCLNDLRVFFIQRGCFSEPAYISTSTKQQNR